MKKIVDQAVWGSGTHSHITQEGREPQVSPRLSSDSLRETSTVDAQMPLEDALDLLISGDFQTRWGIIRTFVVYGEPAAIALAELLENDALDAEVRWFVVRALSEFEASWSVAPLVRLLQNTQDTDLVAGAVEGLSQYGETGVRAIAALMTHPNLCRLAVQTLGQMRHPATLEPLLAATEHPDPVVRTAAIAGISVFRQPMVMPKLVAAIKDPAASVRQAAVTALGVRAHQCNPDALLYELLPCLWDINLAVCQATAIALSRIGTATAVASLSRVLQSPHTPEPLQISVVQALGWIPSESALSALLSAWATITQPAVRLEIVEVLTRLEREESRHRAGEALHQWLETRCPENAEPQHHDVTCAIALALARLGYRPACPLLTTLAQSENPQIQVYAEAALRQFAAQ